MNSTLAIIKPDAFKANYTGKIIDIILKNEFFIKAMKLVKLSEIEAKGFYQVHREKPFFNDLIKFMTSGPSIVMVLEKENAVEEWRALMGETDPKKAKEGTIRALYGHDIEKNAVHGSDSNENAHNEIAYFFPQIDLL
ncbi:MAG: nucleoside-diphosphate kinase [Deferribacterota bacterium]|nr:nucleoside-diphosphate kinase [Deferribacterota bacterium]